MCWRGGGAPRDPADRQPRTSGRWRQDGLFALGPKAFGTGGVSYLLGHQPPFGETDTTLGVLFVPSEKRLVALNATDGRGAWDSPRVFNNQVVRMERTRHGLLLRGEDWIDLLDTGKSVWRAPVPLKNSTWIVLRGDTVYVAADKKVLAIQIQDGSVRTLTTVKFKDEETPSGFGVFE